MLAPGSQVAPFSARSTGTKKWPRAFWSKTIVPTDVWPTKCLVDTTMAPQFDYLTSLFMLSRPNVCRSKGVRPKGAAPEKETDIFFLFFFFQQNRFEN